MFAATRAIFPFSTATSSAPRTFCAGSITLPPFSSRSYMASLLRSSCRWRGSTRVCATALAGRSVQSPPRRGAATGRPLGSGVRQILDDGFLRGVGARVGLIDDDVALAKVAQHLAARPQGAHQIHIAPDGH